MPTNWPPGPTTPWPRGSQRRPPAFFGGAKGAAYTKEITAYDNAYRATGEQVVLPIADPLVSAGVPETLSFSTAYNRNGTLKQRIEPGVAGLPLEVMAPKYNEYGLPSTLAGVSGYVQDTAYSPLGQVELIQLGQAPQTANQNQVWITNTYEPGTRRLSRSNVTDATNPWMAQDLNYGYDQAGNVISISDPVTMGGTGKVDHQCFDYDGYQRLTEAWTPATDDCAPGKRTAANLSGAAPYWSSFAYNDAGLRTTETQHASTGDTVIGYGYDKTRSHQLTQTTTTRPDGTTNTAKYTYDDLGNTRTRPGAQGAQTLTWDAEGQLVNNAESAKDTVPAKNTNYLYDADGSLLIRRNPDGDGDTILYLGATEVRLTARGTGKTLSSTRYYTHAGQTVAVRTATQGTSGSRLTWQAGDHHGTANLSITADTQAVTKRYTTPFGAPRGGTPVWVDDKTFLGKPTDTGTGLTHVGAREYDPLIGRFLSVDPVMNTAKPLSLNGYTYTENNPVTIADPTGLDGSCPYPSGSAQLKNCSDYASSSNGMLTAKERTRRTQERRQQIIDENYNACRSGRGGCGGGGTGELPKKYQHRNRILDSGIWKNTVTWVNRVAPVISAIAFAAMLLTPVGAVAWLVTAVAVAGYAAIVADTVSLVVGGVETYHSVSDGDGGGALTNAAGAVLSGVGLGAFARVTTAGAQAQFKASQAAARRGPTYSRAWKEAQVARIGSGGCPGCMKGRTLVNYGERKAAKASLVASSATMTKYESLGLGANMLAAQNSILALPGNEGW